MKKRTKIILAVAAGLAVITALTGTIFAYLQSTKQAENQFRIGEGDVGISEVFEEPTYVQTQTEKVVTVKNEGTADQFVRVYLDFSDSRIRDKSKILYANSPEQGVTWDAFLANLPEGWAYVAETDPTDGALLGGYFYYTKALKPGETTPPLIQGVKTAQETNTDNITDFDIVVYSESVQTTEIYADIPATPDSSWNWRAAWTSFLSLSQ